MRKIIDNPNFHPDIVFLTQDGDLWEASKDVLYNVDTGIFKKIDGNLLINQGEKPLLIDQYGDFSEIMNVPILKIEVFNPYNLEAVDKLTKTVPIIEIKTSSNHIYKIAAMNNGTYLYGLKDKPLEVFPNKDGSFFSVSENKAIIKTNIGVVRTSSIKDINISTALENQIMQDTYTVSEFTCVGDSKHYYLIENAEKEKQLIVINKDKVELNNKFPASIDIDTNIRFSINRPGIGTVYQTNIIENMKTYNVKDLNTVYNLIDNRMSIYKDYTVDTNVNVNPMQINNPFIKQVNNNYHNNYQR